MTVMCIECVKRREALKESALINCSLDAEAEALLVSLFNELDIGAKTKKTNI